MQAESTPPPRPTKKERTRAALTAAAATLFRVQGYEDTTVEQIAAGAGVTARTFFRYFPTKDAVVFANADERYDAFVAQLAAQDAAETPLVTVRRAFRATVREFAEHRQELVLQHRVIESSPTLIARERELDRRWEQALAHHLGADAPDALATLRARLLAGAFMGAVRAMFDEWYASDGKAGLLALAAETEALLAGFG